MSESPVDHKYIVFKRDEFNKRVQQGLTPLDANVVLDAVVIRRQDMAAPPLLDAYSNFYLAVKDILVTLSENGQESLFNQSQLNERIRKCDELAQYFHEQATASWDTHRKFPT